MHTTLDAALALVPDLGAPDAELPAVRAVHDPMIPRLSLPPMLSDFEQRHIEHLLSQFYDRRLLAHVQHQVRLSHVIRGNSVTLFESRPRFDDPSLWFRSPVAQFRLDPATGLWSLYHRDRNRKWHLYEQCAPARDLGRLLVEVDRDPTHIFWG